jgi:hypothetical protein
VFQRGCWVFWVRLRKNIGVGFSRFVKYEVGDVFNIKFWYDLKGEDQILKAAFPELFNIACCEGASVVDYVQFFDDTL